MQDKEQYPKVVIIGTLVVVSVLIGFPLTAYLSFKENTKDVIF
jgi:hypothetical protein